VERALLRLFPNHLISVMLNNHPLFNPALPNQRFEIWAHIRLERAPDAKIPVAILVDRIALSPREDSAASSGTN
jgi:hypothetical protein